MHVSALLAFTALHRNAGQMRKDWNKSKQDRFLNLIAMSCIEHCTRTALRKEADVVNNTDTDFRVEPDDNRAAVSNTDETGAFTQLVCWQGTDMPLQPSDREIDDLQQMFANRGFRIRFEAVVRTLPGCGGAGNRSDVFFYLHRDDVAAFALFRLLVDSSLKWWEDVVDNGQAILYTDAFVRAHPAACWRK